MGKKWIAKRKPGVKEGEPRWTGFDDETKEALTKRISDAKNNPSNYDFKDPDYYRMTMTQMAKLESLLSEMRDLLDSAEVVNEPAPTAKKPLIITDEEYRKNDLPMVQESSQLGSTTGSVNSSSQQPGSPKV